MNFNSVVLRALEESMDLLQFKETSSGYVIPSSQTVPLFDVGEELYYFLVTPDYVSSLWLYYPNQVRYMLGVKAFTDCKCSEDHIYNTINDSIKTTKYPFRNDKILETYSHHMDKLKQIHGTWYMQKSCSDVMYNGSSPLWEYYIVKHVDFNLYSKANQIAGDLSGF
jgi:hypothetical protein